MIIRWKLFILLGNLVRKISFTRNWKSGSNPNDAGLSGKSGSFTAIKWSEPEKNEKPLRRGFLRPSENHHALNHADGTPFFIIGDTWYSFAPNRFKWYDDNTERPMGPNAGFKDYVRYHKAQGYNWVNVIAAFPNWKTDDSSWHMVMNDPAKTTIRSAWLEFGTGRAKIWIMKVAGRFSFQGKYPVTKTIFLI